MKLKLATKTEVKSSPGRGLGVFAIDYILEGEIIEECHMVTLPPLNGGYEGLLVDHRFNWPSNTETKEQVIVLGNGSIYNHRDDNNAIWRDHPRYKLFQFVAKRDIHPKEEIFTYYGDDNYWDARKHTKKI
tara:strand:- start:1809 stop:2201 length:393 start_codon:yes stop_codon:yes gene_type:complete